MHLNSGFNNSDDQKEIIISNQPNRLDETQKKDDSFTNDVINIPESWTTRLISSERFTSSMAIEYLNSIQDKPVLAQLGKKLFELPECDMDFFLPQLIHLYVLKIDVASVSHAYIENRSKKDAHFSILCLWLLNCSSKSQNNKLENQGLMLRKLLSNDHLHVNADDSVSTLCLNRLEEESWLFHPKNVNPIVGNSSSDDFNTFIPRPVIKTDLVAHQKKFFDGLCHIGTRLTELHLLSSKQEKTLFLKTNLQMLNSMLPGSIWIPFDHDNVILNICVAEAAVLNSKDKVPYIFFAEVTRSKPEKIIESKMESDLNSRRSSVFKPLKDMEYQDSNDPSVAVFAESWADKKGRVKAMSQFSSDSWDLVPIIIKTGDDLSQEAFAQQLLFIFKDLWQEEGVPLYLRPYKIVCINSNAGLIEPILDTLSFHQIKRHLTNVFRKNGNNATPTLKNHFESAFGPVNSENYVNAQKNFIQSAAAYSLVSYFLQLKDRHNGNILLDMEGHLIHIDFGFLLSSSPRNLGFEKAPFKLTSETIEVMGGLDSDMFLYYKSLLLRGFMAARKHHRRIVSLAEIMSTDSKMPCFRAGNETVRALEGRFHVSSTDEQLQQTVDYLVDGSRDNYTTRFYDSFQYYTNGIH